MFDTGYAFRYVMAQKPLASEPFLHTHIYTFRCGQTGLRYMVLLEEFGYNFYTIKFYPKIFADSSKKYNLMTNAGRAAPIINTCLNIMADILSKDPLASFGFTGAPLDSESDQYPTKRYRIYKRIMENFFSPENFYHYTKSSRNAYFLVNRKKDQPEQLVQQLERLLEQHYEF